MPRATSHQINAEITDDQHEALDKAVASKYPNMRGMRAQFIREAVAAAVRAQGVKWEDGIESQYARKKYES